jgi:hypothetical protein
MKSQVFNNKIGSPYSFDNPRLSKEQDLQILAELFEQLLIFDQITISTNRVNFALTFLISRLGIEVVERLLVSGYIKIMIYSPILMTSNGRQQKDGTIDQSVIFGQPPIASGTLSEEDLDPERNVSYALSNFNLSKDVKRNFTKKAVSNYIVPDGMKISSNSEKLIINAYTNNNLVNLGLPFEKEPNQLNSKERFILLGLGHKVIETSILSTYNMKSYDNYDHIEICKQNFSNIGKAFNISTNTTEILKLENTPNLKELFLSERLDFETVFKIRHLSNAKYYRKWVNEVGENSNINEVTAEYINQVKGNTKFFETTKGKFTKNLSSFVIGQGLGSFIGGITGPVVGAIMAPVADYGLGLLETFWLDNILKGKNPSMFIEDIKKQIVKK